MTQSKHSHNEDFIRSAWLAFDPDRATSRYFARNACVIRLTIATIQTPGNVGTMKTSDVDLEKGLWTFEPFTLPMNVVPLTPLARSYIRRGLELRTDADKDWVFPKPASYSPRFRYSLVARHFKKIAIEQSWPSVVVNSLNIASWALSDALEIPYGSLTNLLGMHHLYPDEMEDKRRTLAVWENFLTDIIGANALQPISSTTTGIRRRS